MKCISPRKHPNPSFSKLIVIITYYELLPNFLFLLTYITYIYILSKENETEITTSTSSRKVN